jgi:hypothetical protein
VTTATTSLDKKNYSWWKYSVVGIFSSIAAFVVVGVGGVDDSYITGWVALNISRSGSLSNFNGDSIEQSTSLLHVLILGALRFVTRLPVPVLSYFVGIAGLIATVTMAGVVAERLYKGSGLVTALIVGTSFPLLYWATSGLETLLVPFFLLLFLMAIAEFVTAVSIKRRDIALLLIASLLLAGIRPDALVVSVGVVALLLVLGICSSLKYVSAIVPRVNFQRACFVAIPVGLGILVVEGFRFVVFRHFIPQPVSAKTGLHLTLQPGLSYVFKNMNPGWLWIPFACVSIIGIFLMLSKRSLLAWMATFAGVISVGLVVLSGGDWMGMGRMLIPSMTILLVMAGIGLVYPSEVIKRISVFRIGRLLLPVITVAAVCLQLVALRLVAVEPTYFKERLATDAPLMYPWKITENVNGKAIAFPISNSVPWYVRRNSSHLRDTEFLNRMRPIIAKLVAQESNKNRKITLASYQAGMIPFYLFDWFPGRLHFTDMFSLTTTDFSRCPIKKHERFGMPVTYDYWFQHAGKCAPDMPDLVFGLGKLDPQLVGKYRVVAEQDLSMQRGSDTRIVHGWMFLAQRIGYTN